MPLITPFTVKKDLPQREKNAYKGDCGRLLIIAGSKGMVGAGILSAFGAVRSGAGLVKLATVKSQQVVAAKRAPLECTTLGLPEDQFGGLSDRAWKIIDQIIKSFKPTVIAAGPGLGQRSPIRRIILNLIRKTPCPLVLDADALNVLKFSDFGKQRTAPVVITPHVGELSRLMKVSAKKINSHRDQAVRLAAQKLKCICLLKGAGTLVSNGKEVWKNTTGNPAMASGGMGDVLTGIIAALWGQTKEKNQHDGFRAARVGAYVHGLAGDVAWRKDKGMSILASDLIAQLPKAFSLIKKGEHR